MLYIYSHRNQYLATTTTVAPYSASKIASNPQKTFRKEVKTFRLRREAIAINFVRSRTSIPVPSLLEAQLRARDDEYGRLVMERTPGTQLGEAWSQLHQICLPDPDWIGSCDGGPAYDHRLDNKTTCGPFFSIAELNEFLVAPVKNCPRADWVASYRNKLADDCRIVFAHADMSWENILVDPQAGSVTGIVDWEMAGFWPEETHR
ncbi:kinase-like domain-containing protein [Xylaria grammica]|nr:kinase-like domain-containing protein [Xylaria grammica]